MHDHKSIPVGAGARPQRVDPVLIRIAWRGQIPKKVLLLVLLLLPHILNPCKLYHLGCTVKEASSFKGKTWLAFLARSTFDSLLYCQQSLPPFIDWIQSAAVPTNMHTQHTHKVLPPPCTGSRTHTQAYTAAVPTNISTRSDESLPCGLFCEIKYISLRLIESE